MCIRDRAFIAHDGIFNMEMQYLETEEKWFANWNMGGAYWEKQNPAAQRTFANSPHLFVEKWDTPILLSLIHISGVMIGPWFGQRGIDGKFVASKYTRTHDIPTSGICLGMQCIAIEFARNVLGYTDANSREMDEKTPHNVIDIMEEQKAITNMGCLLYTS